jgi:hypothetical protein
MVFSDYMYKFDAHMEKHRVIMLMTDSSMYLLSLKNYSVINHVKLKELKSILLIESNANIFAFNFVEHFDLLMESVRRTEMVIYLVNNADNDPDRRRPEIKTAIKIRVQSQLPDARKEVLAFDKAEFQQNVLSASVQKVLIETNTNLEYIMAYKYGYLQKKAKVWYKTWVERFYVLSSIGLIYMENPNAKEIKAFQCIDFDVLKIAKTEYNRQWVLKIKNRQEDDEVVL